MSSRDYLEMHIYFHQFEDTFPFWIQQYGWYWLSLQALNVIPCFPGFGNIVWIPGHILFLWSFHVIWHCFLTAFSTNVFFFLFDLLYERTAIDLFIVPEKDTQRRDKGRNGWFSSKNVSGQWSCPFLEVFYCQILKAFNFPLLIMFYILLWELLTNNKNSMHWD